MLNSALQNRVDPEAGIVRVEQGGSNGTAKSEFLDGLVEISGEENCVD